jgi:hypothetical protein
VPKKGDSGAEKRRSSTDMEFRNKRRDSGRQSGARNRSTSLSRFTLVELSGIPSMINFNCASLSNNQCVISDMTSETSGVEASR